MSKKGYPNYFWRGSVLYLIGMIILPLVLLVLIIAIGSTWLHQQAMRTLVGERDILATKAVAKAINANIQHRLSTLESLAVLYDIETDPFHQREFSLSQFLENFDMGVAIFSVSGELLLSMSSEAFTLETQELPYAFEDLLLDNRGLNQVISLPIDDSTVILLKTRSTNRKVAVGLVTIEKLIEEIIPETVPATQEGLILIINSDQNIVYQTGNSSHEIALTNHPNIIEGFKNKNGTFLLQDQSIEYVVSFSSVAETDWLLVMVEPWQAVTTPILELTRIAPLVLVPVLLISLAGLWFGSQQIVKPLRDLEKKSDLLSAGNFDDIKQTVGGITEIRQLQTKLVQMAESVQTSQKNVQEYIGSITEAQEEERLRLARELHDDTIQSMIALKQRVQLAERSADDPSSKQALDELEKIAEQTIENLRRITRALRPIYLEDLGMVAALEMLVKETSNLSGLTVTFELDGIEKRLSPQVELALYRIAQEAISNVVRHANASQIILSLQFGETSVMQVVDDGTGFKAPQTSSDFASSGHFGLMGMYERAELIGANLTINSGLGHGTFITIAYPENS